MSYSIFLIIFIESLSTNFFQAVYRYRLDCNIEKKKQKRNTTWAQHTHNTTCPILVQLAKKTSRFNDIITWMLKIVYNFALLLLFFIFDLSTINSNIYKYEFQNLKILENKLTQAIVPNTEEIWLRQYVEEIIDLHQYAIKRHAKFPIQFSK